MAGWSVAGARYVRQTDSRILEILPSIARELHEKPFGLVLAICTIGRLLCDEHWRGRTLIEEELLLSLRFYFCRRRVTVKDRLPAGDEAGRQSAASVTMRHSS
jgi:hypothetical protein